MKYWNGIGQKAGYCGTMDDNGFVPDAVECSRYEYEQSLQFLPVVAYPVSDIEKVVAWAKSEGHIK